MNEYCEENLCTDPLAPQPTPPQSPSPVVSFTQTRNSVNSFIDGIFFGLGFVCVLLVLYWVLQYHWQRQQEQQLQEQRQRRWRQQQQHEALPYTHHYSVEYQQ